MRAGDASMPFSSGCVFLFSVFVSLFELFSARQVAGQEMRKSVFSHFGHSKGVVNTLSRVRSG